jgi:hypothetical protein
MKMTMHIDDDLLNRVIAAHGFRSKTEAVEAALIELDRQHKIREFRKHGLGLTPAELGDAVYPDYDPEALRGKGYAVYPLHEDPELNAVAEPTFTPPPTPPRDGPADPR